MERKNSLRRWITVIRKAPCHFWVLILTRLVTFLQTDSISHTCSTQVEAKFHEMKLSEAKLSQCPASIMCRSNLLIKWALRLKILLIVSNRWAQDRAVESALTSQRVLVSWKSVSWRIPMLRVKNLQVVSTIRRLLTPRRVLMKCASLSKWKRFAQ